MAGPQGAFDRIALNRIAFGVRFSNQFGLGDDVMGTIIDDILASPTSSPDRFAHALGTPDRRQLQSANGEETLTIARNDCVYENASKDFGTADLSDAAREFIDVFWAAVVKRAPRQPQVMRYGCMVGFPAPETWNPIQTILDADPVETSELDLRYVRRVPAEAALVRDVSDYRNAIFLIQSRNAKTSAVIDFQHVFSPPLASNQARKDNPFDRFVDKAVAYFRNQGWDFLQSRAQRVARAA